MNGVWLRYVAVGDSFSEGMSDPDPAAPGSFRGWADRLAGHLAADTADAGDAGFEYANLAVRGRLLHDIVTRQLDGALALGPDLVSIVGGGNDILRPRADIDARARSKGEQNTWARPKPATRSASSPACCRPRAVSGGS